MTRFRLDPVDVLVYGVEGARDRAEPPPDNGCRPCHDRLPHLTCLTPTRIT